ncbi:hypothetical protein KR093_009138, partial [Drosophila rubida]
VGGVTLLTGDDLKVATVVLSTSLTQLASVGGPNYQLGEILSVTRQTESGIKYVYQVELISQGKDTKPCNVKIWSQPWQQDGYEVTIKCIDGKVVEKHN